MGGAPRVLVTARPTRPGDAPRSPCEAERVSEHTTIDLLLSALRFAAEKHRLQRRKDPEASPYINHPIAVASVLFHEAGIADPITLAAAVLHDTVEDTETTAAELRAQFGDEVMQVVLEVTDDKSLPKERRKALQIEHAPHLSVRAQQVKLADKIANLRDVASAPPTTWSLERRQAYFMWGKAVADQLRGRYPKLDALIDDAYARRPA
jgi:guanosine-3',5'-bis(diphosphate) 3'-pyrophosphohydrolase